MISPGSRPEPKNKIPTSKYSRNLIERNNEAISRVGASALSRQVRGSFSPIWLGNNVLRVLKYRRAGRVRHAILTNKMPILDEAEIESLALYLESEEE